MTDTVQFLDTNALPETHRKLFGDLRQRLSNAAQASRIERAGESNASPAEFGAILQRKGQDYAETQPEWALAGNAVFIIAERAVSQSQSLNGAAFLHSYDMNRDDDGSILEMILTAPGGEGDLFAGLSRESLARDTLDGSAHKPLRLHLMIQADAEKTRRIILRHESLRKLVLGEWLRVSLIKKSADELDLVPLTPEALLESEQGEAVAAE